MFGLGVFTCVCSFWGLSKEATTLTSIITPERNKGAEAPIVYLQLVSTFLKPVRVLEKQDKVIVDSGSLRSSSGD